MRAPAGTRTSAAAATSPVAACIGTDPGDPQAFFTAQLIWQQLHGIVRPAHLPVAFP